MKRLLCIILTGVMVLASVGCGSKTKEQKSVETTAAETEETKAEETEAEATEETKTGTHVIVDHLGIEVEVPYEVNRIAVGNILPLPSVLTVFFDSAE